MLGRFVAGDLAAHDTSVKSHTTTPSLRARVTAISSPPKEVSKGFSRKKMSDFQDSVLESEPAGLCFFFSFWNTLLLSV